MTLKEYREKEVELSIKFIQLKNEGKIPMSMGWAEWCWSEGIYPLTQEK